jgi:nucleotide-binding universal stress UspA family protein
MRDLRGIYRRDSFADSVNMECEMESPKMGEVIAVAVDGTPAGQSALALAGKQAGRTSAHVAVLCTVDTAYALEMHNGAISREDETEYPAAAREELAAEKIIGEALRNLEALGIEASGEILVGTPAHAIVAAANRLSADMIVMGHRHLSWFDRMLHPSVCWDILEHSTCPVLFSIAEE